MCIKAIKDSAASVHLMSTEWLRSDGGYCLHANGSPVADVQSVKLAQGYICWAGSLTKW